MEFLSLFPLIMMLWARWPGCAVLTYAEHCPSTGSTEVGQARSRVEHPQIFYRDSEALTQLCQLKNKKQNPQKKTKKPPNKQINKLKRTISPKVLTSLSCFKHLLYGIRLTALLPAITQADFFHNLYMWATAGYGSYVFWDTLLL